MALKIDKEALIEFSIAKKDQLFIGLLIAILIGGGLYLYLSTSTKVDDYLTAMMANDAPGGGKTKTKTPAVALVPSEKIVENLAFKLSIALYTPEKNPFGSPEEERQINDLVQSAYNAGVQAFKSGDFDKAAQQFDRVITLDVTESRVSYPTLPSEYKRMALRENAKKNLDKILASATNNISEGDRFQSQNKTAESLVSFNAADKVLSEILQSDPDGAIIGQANFQKVKELQQQAFNKSVSLRRQSLLNEMTTALNQAQTFSQGADYIGMLKALFTLVRLQKEVTLIDPNSDLIKKNNRDRLTSLVTDLQTKIQGNTPVLVSQAEQQFKKAIESQDHTKAQEAISALTQSLTFAPKNLQELQTKIKDFVNRRAQLVVQLAQGFYTAQKAILDSQKQDQFDQNGKMTWLQELNTLRRTGGKDLSADLNNQIVSAENQLKGLRLPPQLTEEFDFIKVTLSAGNAIKIDYKEKSASASVRPASLLLKEGQNDRRTKITVKQVDTANGFVILSKLGCSDTRVPLTQEATK